MINPEAMYDLESVKMPYLAGRPLKLFASFLAGSAGGAATKSLLDSAGITWLRRQRSDEPPTFTPLAGRNGQPQPPQASPDRTAPVRPAHLRPAFTS
ncbi:MAG: hypothetical protein IPF56_23890 [Chloroflexi bacterium]|nr:hypothetical protein [Chloroflexota bacterium]